MKYKDYLNKFLSKLSIKKKEVPLDDLLDKYIVEDKKEIMKEKLEKISQIIAETEGHIVKTVKTKVKVAEAQLKEKELEQIKKAGLDYETFSSDLTTAMPTTEAERLKDMNELKNTILMLESFDEESYKVEKKVIDAGLGIFYEKMSRRFTSIINKYNLNDNMIIPVQRVMYHAFLDIKNIKEKDILPILNIMKETKLLSDIIEINPTLHIIVFTDETLNISLPEKVILSFAYDEDFLIVQKLIELTEWSEEYTNNIIKRLIEKNIIQIIGDTIDIRGFGHKKERRKWNELIQEKSQKHKEIEEKKQTQYLKRKKQLEQRLAQIELTKIPETEPIKSDSEILPEKEFHKIKFWKKPKVKALPTFKKKFKVKAKEIDFKEKQKIKDKDDLVSAMEALDEIMPIEPLKVAKNDNKEISLDLLEANLGLKDLGEKRADLEDLIPEKILNYHEKYSLINGGFVQYDLIKEYIDKELTLAPEDLIKAILGQLKELQLIQFEIKIGEYVFYCFNEIELNDDDKKFISFAIDKKPLNKGDFIKGLGWDEEKTLATMKDLQDKKILRIEKDKIIIPGIVQKKIMY